MSQEFLCDDRESLYQKVANRCAMQLSRGVEKNGRASFIVPGGTTPAPVFNQLSQMSLLWNNILIAPSDERWLNPDQPQSNQRLIENELLINNAAKSKLMPLKMPTKTPFEAESLAQKSISELNQPFDVCLLGMGPDGHFASLFPDCEQLPQALDISNSKKKCIAINAEGCPVAGEYTQRMSLTLSAILNSQLIILMFTGKEKLATLNKAKTESNPLKKPVAALLTQTQTPVEIYWAE